MATNQEKFDMLTEHVSGGQQTTWMKRLGEVIAPVIAPAIAKAVLTTSFKRRDGADITLAGQMSWWAEDIAKLSAQNAGLLEALKQSASGSGAVIDYDKVGEASAKAIAAYIDTVEKTTTTINLKESA